MPQCSGLAREGQANQEVVHVLVSSVARISYYSMGHLEGFNRT